MSELWPEAYIRLPRQISTFVVANAVMKALFEWGKTFRPQKFILYNSYLHFSKLKIHYKQEQLPLNARSKEVIALMEWTRAMGIGKILSAQVDFDDVRSILIIIALNSLFTSISNIFCHSNSYQFFYYLKFFIVLTTNFFLSKCSYLPMLLVVRHPKIDDKCHNRTIKNLSFLQQCWNEN